MNKADFDNLLQSDLQEAYSILQEYTKHPDTPQNIKDIGNKMDVLYSVITDMQPVMGAGKIDIRDCVKLYTQQLIQAYKHTLPDVPKSEKQQELDTLFGNSSIVKNELWELREECDPDNTPISGTVKTNVDLISTHNSDNALPDKLANVELTPISNGVTEGVHDGDTTCNTVPISSHNSSKFVDTE